MITGRSGADDIVSCMSDGQAADYIVKPFVAGEFLKKINTALDSSRKVPESAVNNELLDKVEEKIRKTLDNK
jgi:DNA-binding response OmpR family regulator